jgi:hypothetical protein
MACFTPTRAFRLADGRLSFQPNDREEIAVMWLDCNHCAGCIKRKASQISLRLQHEAHFHKDNICGLLTYSDDKLPENGSLCKRHYDLFTNKMRMRAKRKYNLSVVFHGVGEYSEVMRPHYHVIIFGFRPGDAKPHFKNARGEQIYTSAELEEVWGHGLVGFQEFTPGSANYVAKHQASKLRVKTAPELVLQTPKGVVIRAPEFESRPKSPALGAAFCQKYADTLLAHDFTVDSKFKRVSLPRYYDTLLTRIDPDRMSEIKAERSLKAMATFHDQTRERLAVREEFEILERQRITGVRR